MQTRCSAVADTSGRGAEHRWQGCHAVAARVGVEDVGRAAPSLILHTVGSWVAFQPNQQQRGCEGLGGGCRWTTCGPSAKDMQHCGAASGARPAPRCLPSKRPHSATLLCIALPLTAPAARPLAALTSPSPGCSGPTTAGVVTRAAHPPASCRSCAQTRQKHSRAACLQGHSSEET